MFLSQLDFPEEKSLLLTGNILELITGLNKSWKIYPGFIRYSAHEIYKNILTQSLDKNIFGQRYKGYLIEKVEEEYDILSKRAGLIDEVTNGVL